MLVRNEKLGFDETADEKNETESQFEVLACMSSSGFEKELKICMYV